MKRKFNAKGFMNKVFGETPIERDVKNPVRRVIHHGLLSKKYGDMQRYHQDACSYWIDQYHKTTGNSKKETVEAEPVKSVNGVGVGEDGLFHPFNPVVFH